MSPAISLESAPPTWAPAAGHEYKSSVSQSIRGIQTVPESYPSSSRPIYDQTMAALEHLRRRSDSSHEGDPACDHCRRRKTKCDRMMPTCGRCARLGRTCSRQDILMRRGPPSNKERAAYQAAGLPIPSLKYRNRNRRTETTEVTEDYPKRNSMQLERTRQQAPHHRPTPLRSSEGSASPAFESDAPFQPVTSPSPFSVTASAPFHVYNNEGAVHPNAHPPGEYAYHTMSFPSIPANAYSNPGPLLRDFPSSAPISPMYTTEKKLPTAWPLSDESFMPAHPQPPPEHPHALDHPPSWPLSPESSGSWPETVPVGPPGGGGPPLGTANGLPTSQSSHLTYDFPHFPPPQHDYSSVGPEPMYPQYRGTGASTTLMYPRSSVQFPPS